MKMIEARRGRLAGKGFFRACLLVSLFSLAAGCASISLSIDSEDVARIRASLEASYWPGYEPLARPVAVVDNGEWHFLNGPCEGLDRKECESLFPHIRLVAPGTTYILESTGQGRLYSTYVSTQAERLIRRIAHEQFHVFLARLQVDDEAGEKRVWREPTADEIAATLNELHFLKEANAADTKSLACARSAHDQRLAIAQPAANSLLRHVAKTEGSALFVEAMYAARGNVDAGSDQLSEFHQQLLEGGEFDWPNLLTLFGYYMGAKANLLTSDLELPAVAVPRSLQAQFALWPPGKCGKAPRYAADSPIVRKIKADTQSRQMRALESFFTGETIHFVPMNQGSFEYAANARANFPGGIIIWGDVVVHQDGGVHIATDAPIVLLPCGQEERKGILVNGGSGATANATPVSAARARQMILEPAEECPR